MNNVMVSVCVLSYNHERYLRQCLDGIFMQKVSFPIEVRVHDDASTDKSQDIIREYQERYPNVLKPILQSENQYSKGGGILAKFLFPLCEGKYIALCEGDDYWTDPLKLQKQVDFMETHEGYSMCFHAVDVLNESSRCSWIHCDKIENRDYFTNDVFPDWVVHSSSVLFKRGVPEKYRLRHPEWLKAGDTVLVLKCMHLGKVRGMSDHMSVYRMNDNSVMSHPISMEDYIQHIKCILINFPNINKEYCYREIYAYDYGRFKCGDRGGRWRYILDAIMTSPSYVWKMQKRRLKNKVAFIVQKCCKKKEKSAFF